ncbi:MAG: hypothetical protein WCT37_02895 [Patescibacteria group bacterium]|jgi:hypothetical protein
MAKESTGGNPQKKESKGGGVATALEAAANLVSGEGKNSMLDFVEPHLRTILEKYIYDPTFKGSRGRAIRAFYKANPMFCNLIAGLASLGLQKFEPRPGLLRTAHELAVDSISEFLRRSRGEFVSAEDLEEAKKGAPDEKKKDDDLTPADFVNAFASIKVPSKKGDKPDEIETRIEEKRKKVSIWLAGLGEEKLKVVMKKGVFDKLIQINDEAVREQIIDNMISRQKTVKAQEKKGKSGLELHAERLTKHQDRLNKLRQQHLGRR